ncbi:MAG: 6-carboxytetrahydropterin synthase QueD [Thermoactinomyces sp.]
MYTITKRYHFSASHQLDHLPEEHPCSRLHGHNYQVEIVLKSETLNQQAFVRDYGELKPFQRYLEETLDHRHLNDVLPCVPTAENLAKWLFDWAKKRWNCVVAVKVSDTPKTWAIYSEAIFS